MARFFGKKEKADDAEIIRLSKLTHTVDRIISDTDEDRKKMSRYLKEFRGEWWDEKELKSSDSKIFVNYVFSTAMSIAPLITDNRPTWSVNARHPYMQRIGDLYNVCLEYLWDKLECDRFMFRWVLSALVMKKGILEVTFDPDDGVGGEIAIDIVDPRTFFIAPGYSDLWKAPFCGTRVSRPLSWIRGRYPEKGELVKVESKEDKDEPFAMDEKETWQLHSDNATVYTVWMKSDEIEEEEFVGEGGEKEKREKAKYPHGKILVFTKSVLLEEKPSVYKHSRPPFVDLDDYVDPVSFMGMGEADQIEQLNRSYNRGMQLIDKFTTLYCDPNWLADDSAGIDTETIKAALPGGGNVFAYNGMSNAEPIKRMEMGELPQTLFSFLTATPKIIEEVSGVTEISKGMATKTERQTAAEISTLIESSYTRTRQRVRNFEHSLKRLGWLFIQIMQQFYTEERQISLNRDDSVEYRTVSSSPEFLDNYMQPRPPQNPEDPEQAKEYEQERKDYEQFQEFIAELGPIDPVMADFDIVIETNSTLPMDKQALANLFLRLLSMKAIDPQAVLEQLRVPKYKQITKRMQQMAQMQMQAKSGGAPQQRPGQQMPAPRDVQDMLNARPEGV